MMHIALIVAITFAAFSVDRSKVNSAASFREATSYFALTAFQGIFLSYNMFFILDESKRPDLIHDEFRNITY